MEPPVLKHFVWSLVFVLVASAGAAAQPAPAAQDPVKARYRIFVMEGVLERAVDHGADRLRHQVRRVFPDMLLISGASQARGFRLEGYGVFFDVEVPVLRRSVAWSLRTMIDEHGMAAATALQQLKAFIDSAADPRTKAGLEQALRRIELQVGPTQPVTPAPALAGTGERTVTAMEAAPAATQPAPMSAADRMLLENPSQAYEREVISALIDAMLDHSGPIGIGPDEWLTVAARDNEHRDRLMPGDLYDLMTIVLRVKGSDLAAFRAERITREEARKRVEVKEF